MATLAAELEAKITRTRLPTACLMAGGKGVLTESAAGAVSLFFGVGSLFGAGERGGTGNHSWVSL